MHLIVNKLCDSRKRFFGINIVYVFGLLNINGVLGLNDLNDHVFKSIFNSFKTQIAFSLFCIRIYFSTSLDLVPTALVKICFLLKIVINFVCI